MTKFLWGLFVFFIVWASLIIIGSFFQIPYIGILGFICGIFAGARAAL